MANSLTVNCMAWTMVTPRMPPAITIVITTAAMSSTPAP